MPMPTTTGGQGLEPASSTAWMMAFSTSSRGVVGLSIFSVVMFSLPAPLGATVMDIWSPGTRRR